MFPGKSKRITDNRLAGSRNAVLIVVILGYPIQDYANQLSERIDSFDIAGIQGLLKKFPDIQEGLRAHLADRPAKV